MDVEDTAAAAAAAPNPDEACNWGAEASTQLVRDFRSGIVAETKVGTCQECRKQRLMKDGAATCILCDISSPQSCFAFCEVGKQVGISYEKWIETYASVRCLRDRRGAQRGYFPGFCKEHNKTNPGFQQFWNDLSANEQEILSYMMEPAGCSMLSFGMFIQQEKFKSTPIHRLFQLLFSPLGIMAIRPEYFFDILFVYVQMLRTKASLAMIRRHRDMGGTVDDDFVRTVENSLIEMNFPDDPTNTDYVFLIQHMFQLPTLQWLTSDPDPQVKTMHWNMLFFKLVTMLMLGVPESSSAIIPRFTVNWYDNWMATMNAVLGSDTVRRLNDEVPLFTDFMRNLDAVVKVIADNVIEEDSRAPIPIVDFAASLQQQCEQRV